jgi:hypothetical protein
MRNLTPLSDDDDDDRRCPEAVLEALGGPMLIRLPGGVRGASTGGGQGENGAPGPRAGTDRRKLSARALDDLLYRVAVSLIFDPDDFDLRWPPELFAEEAHRLLGRRSSGATSRNLAGKNDFLGVIRVDTSSADIEWLLTEAFVSTTPVETFCRVAANTFAQRSKPDRPDSTQWFMRLIREVAAWAEPSPRKPYWSARHAGGRGGRQLEFDDLTRRFIRVVEEFEANGYLAHVFGQECVDDRGAPPLPDRAMILEERAGYPIAHWPLWESRLGWELDSFCDLVEVFHDLVARPTSRWWHDFARCGWHYSAFATGPGRRLYRWRINQLLDASTLGLRLAEEGEDLGRLVRAEPTGLEDLPERAMQAAAPKAVDRVQHAIALFRARSATLEERRSAVITLAGILEERRDLLRAELLTKDETALFQIANQFAVRHQKADQRSDYDPAFLDWLFWWYLGTVQLTDQLLARQMPG